jgi:hypothetical protein
MIEPVGIVDKGKPKTNALNDGWSYSGKILLD